MDNTRQLEPNIELAVSTPNDKDVLEIIGRALSRLFTAENNIVLNIRAEAIPANKVKLEEL